MRHVTHITRVATIAAFSLMTALVWSPATLRAQDDAPHPAHVHDGTCDALGDVVAPLTDLSFEGGNATDGNATDGNGTEGNASEGNASLGNITDGNASNETGGNATNATGGNATGAGDPIPAEVSVTTVPLTLDEMLATPHAINVHLSADEIGTYIACGDIGGPALPDGSLAIGLHELNGSGFFGIASLTPSTSSEGGTDISVFLAENLIGTGGTTGVGGNATGGNATGGNASDANATDGNGTEGNGTAGNATDGNATGGNASNGTDGNATNGNGTGGDDGGNGTDDDDDGGNGSGGNDSGGNGS